MPILTPRSQFISKLNNYNNSIINHQKSTFIITTSINKSLLFRSSNNNNNYKNYIFKSIISSTFNRGLATKSCSSCADAASAAPVVIPKLNRAEKGALIEKMKSYYEENYVDSFNKELLKDVKNYVQKKSGIYLNCLFYDSLSNDFTQLLEDPIDYNVTIEIGETPSTNIYKVHSIILQSRSPFFKKKFDEITFNDYHVKVLKLPNISVKVFDVIIKYIYGGKISLEKLENSTIFDLVIASNELELDELVEHLQIYLVNNCDSWLRLEFTRIYQQSQVINLEIIQDFYNEIIANLSNDFTQLLEDPIDYNVTIEIGETPSTNIYKVHSIILQSRSPFFKKKFDEITFNDYHVKVLKLPNISVKVFDVIIKYIYGGKISLEKLENSTIFDLVIASNELELDELVEHLQIYLVNNCDSWLRLEFTRIYQQSQVINLEIIQDFYNEIIAKYPKTVFESENFHSITEDALISILKRNDLQLEESKIWEYVIEWGKAKNPTLPTNLDKWTSNNFVTLKETLKGCLPHIRYFSFSSEEVIEKIYPYQELLEFQLFSDIITKFLTPSKPISSIVLQPRNISNTFSTKLPRG
ncbi:hypothetical protein Glove_478g70 [Diversispora epigaea]|uniref:BTB domain-containing protein n=1 Tax=Diversispora epigaea TaxID=1348612 RepID=A0A397GKF3_9GLOM|nr:hypothetical protein Glove_478g70 [Diversispora epigaea]